MADERSTQQQLSDEFLASYKRMTDPEERQKEKIKKRRDALVQDMSDDAGI
jgi:hypothetical protein